MTGPPLKKGRRLRRGFSFRYYSNAKKWDEKPLAHRMISEFIGQIRGVDRRDTPSLDKTFYAPMGSVPDQEFVTDHVHFVPAHWFVRIGAFGGACFFLYACAVLWVHL